METHRFFRRNAAYQRGASSPTITKALTGYPSLLVVKDIDSLLDRLHDTHEGKKILYKREYHRSCPVQMKTSAQHYIALVENAYKIGNVLDCSGCCRYVSPFGGCSILVRSHNTFYSEPYRRELAELNPSSFENCRALRRLMSTKSH